MDKFETLEKCMCKELELLEHKLQSAPEMSTADLDKVDKLTHALKSLCAYREMMDYTEEDKYYSERSGRYGRYGRRY